MEFIVFESCLYRGSESIECILDTDFVLDESEEDYGEEGSIGNDIRNVIRVEDENSSNEPHMCKNPRCKDITVGRISRYMVRQYNRKKDGATLFVIKEEYEQEVSVDKKN